MHRCSLDDTFYLNKWHGVDEVIIRILFLVTSQTKEVKLIII